MKYFNLAILLSSLLFFSCQKELKDPDAPTGNGNGTNLTNCKECIYFPVCDSMRYTNEDSATGGLTVRTDTSLVKRDTTIAGVVYKVVTTPSGATNGMINCTAGVTTQIVKINGANVKIRALMANLPVNGNWTDTISYQGQSIIYQSTIIQKSVARTVLANTYSDVIYVQSIAGQNLGGIGFVPVLQTDYYFARGVGLIEVISTNLLTSEVTLHRKLKNYYIP